ncbi:MAG: hypothetical protein K9L30_14570 [Desulfobacterales bacterium]|nr:hypothetical protein [Desulfobacterales bacterium]
MKTETFLTEYEIIMKAADDQNIPLRLVGAISVILHCPKYAELYQNLSRVVTDIDFMSYGKYNSRLPLFFQKLGYEPEVRHMAYYGKNRHIYSHKNSGIIVDVFFDKLEMCHTIDFRGRLKLDYPTIPLSNILLTKLQIIEINEKDLKDLAILFLEHEIGKNSKDKIDDKYIAEILSSDWGFYYTATNNLIKVKNKLNSFKVLKDVDHKIIIKRIDQLITSVETKQKKLSWKIRSIVGNKIKWYNDIEERVR